MNRTKDSMRLASDFASGLEGFLRTSASSVIVAHNGCGRNRLDIVSDARGSKIHFFLTRDLRMEEISRVEEGKL